MKKIIIVISIIFIINACKSNNNQQLREDKNTDTDESIITKNPVIKARVGDCELSKENFAIIKNRACQNKIIMGDWIVAYIESDNSLSYQKSNEEIFVVFVRGENTELIPLGKTGFTNSTEEQWELFCQTLTFLKNE